MGLKLSGLISLIDCDYLENEFVDVKMLKKYDVSDKNDCRIDIHMINNCKNFVDYEDCPEGSPNGWGFYEDISIYD